jgi:hypothetical protein
VFLPKEVHDRQGAELVYLCCKDANEDVYHQQYRYNYRSIMPQSH